MDYDRYRAAGTKISAAYLDTVLIPFLGQAVEDADRIIFINNQLTAWEKIEAKVLLWEERATGEPNPCDPAIYPADTRAIISILNAALNDIRAAVRARIAFAEAQFAPALELIGGGL